VCPRGRAFAANQVQSVDETRAAVAAVVDLVVNERWAENSRGIEVAIGAYEIAPLFDPFLIGLEHVGDRPGHTAVFPALILRRRHLRRQIDHTWQLGAGIRRARQRHASELVLCRRYQTQESSRGFLGTTYTWRKSEERDEQGNAHTLEKV